MGRAVAIDASTAEPDRALQRRRLLYRATHRGTKEMDWLLGRYVEVHVQAWSLDELEQAEVLVAQSDPELHGWILDPAPIKNTELELPVMAIRRFHGLLD